MRRLIRGIVGFIKKTFAMVIGYTFNKPSNNNKSTILTEVNIADIGKSCVGCGLCEHLCPKQCISLRCDNEGFSQPEIDTEKCVDCGICKKKCPVYKDTVKIEPITAYAIKDKTEESRLKSASGGASAVFAKYILENGGVFSGAKYDNSFNVVHELCEDVDDIDLFRDSKYVQSDMNNIYSKIQNALECGKKVLAVGTPCQIAALRSKFGYENDDLILCDFVCNGVPPPQLLKKYISILEEKENKKIKYIKLRDKSNGWKSSNIKVNFEDESQKIILRRDSEFYKLFAFNIMLRESCYNCKFKKFNIYSDITIGDYWGIDKKYPEFDDDKGCSLVMINTEKGSAFFDKVSHLIDYIETGTEHAVETHPKLMKSVDRNPYRNVIFSEFNENISVKKFKVLVQKYTGSGIINKVKRKLKMKLGEKRNG